MSIVIIGNSDPCNSNTTLPLRDSLLKFITPVKYQMLRLKKNRIFQSNMKKKSYEFKSSM